MTELFGGQPRIIAETGSNQDARGGAWDAGDVILFAPSFVGPIRAVAAGGGEVTAATRIDEDSGIGTQRFPSFLPDGKRFLFYASTGTGIEPGTLWLGELGSLDSKLLGPANSSGVWAAPGYVLYVTGDSLVAHRFDDRRNELVGDPSPLGISLAGTVAVSGQRSLTVAAHGLLAYRDDKAGRDESGGGRSVGDRARGARGGEQHLVLRPAAVARRPARGRHPLRAGVDRRGPLAARAREQYRDPSDVQRGRRLAACRLVSRWPRGRLLVRPEARRNQRHLPHRGGPVGSGTGGVHCPIRSQLRTPGLPTAGGWCIGRPGLQGGGSLWIRSLEGDPSPRRLGQEHATEWGSDLSPDGRWIAYNSDAARRWDVYVRALDSSSGEVRVSTGGRVRTALAPGRPGALLRRSERAHDGGAGPVARSADFRFADGPLRRSARGGG